MINSNVLSWLSKVVAKTQTTATSVNSWQCVYPDVFNVRLMLLLVVIAINSILHIQSTINECTTGHWTNDQSLSTSGQSNLTTNQLVFTVQLRLPVPKAPGSKCPRASIAASCHATSSIRIFRRGSCCCSSAIAGIATGANFKIYLLCQFCSNRVEFFVQYTGDTDAKKWRTRILKFEFCDSWEIFKKASRGPSAANLDHYGRGQTRSE